jgi:hypothetical protein
MRQSAQGKCVFIQVFGFCEKRKDEIAASDIMGQVAEEFAAKRIVTHVLDNRAAINIRMGLQEIFWVRIRETLQELRHNVVLPGCVDDRFMGQDRVPATSGNQADCEQ